MIERRALLLRDEASTPKPRAWIRVALSLLVAAAAVIHLGWYTVDPLVPHAVERALLIAALATYGAALVRDRLQAGREALWVGLRKDGFETTALVIAVVFVWWWPGLLLAAGMIAASNLLRVYFMLIQTAIPPGLVFVGSFIGLIAIGTIFLLLPAATPPDQPISVIDAIFTITSAISQTGLVVRPTGDGFTRFGQIIILIWIQVGALGIILFGSLFALFLGASFGVRATKTLADPTEQGWAGQLSLQKLVMFIIIFTHVVEAIGVAALYFGWPAQWEGAPEIAEPLDRLYHCVFFSVSGFCNAGFVTTSNSLAGLRAHWSIHFIIVLLIVLGSIGFPVLDDLRRNALARIRGRRFERGALVRLTLNTKLILSTTALLYLSGMLLTFVGEITQANQPWGLAVLDAHFMTVNRTSGFNTIEPAEMGMLGQLTFILLMFVGGSPGSVAGGIKVIAFVVLLVTIWSTITGRSQTTVFGRTIPDELVRKCATLTMLSIGAVMFVAGVLAASETGGEAGHSLDEILFESVSAFGTCGLSMGITSELSPVGRVAITVAMFVGRVGPLATMAALVIVARERRTRYAYPAEHVIIY